MKKSKVIGSVALIAFAFVNLTSSAHATGSDTTSSAYEATEKTNTQISLKYFSGIPGYINNSAPSYEDALAAGQSNVAKIEYTTVSKGRIAWGEPNSDGTYSVYFDAADVHYLATNLNSATLAYDNLYSEYQKMVEAAK